MPCPACSCSACLASSLPLPCSFLCHVAREFYFQQISFPFVLPFCGSTKRVGPFVLPQKGRTVPSLFLPLLSQIFGTLEPPTGANFGERVYYEFRSQALIHRGKTATMGLRLPSTMGFMALKHRGKTATLGFLSSLSSLVGLGLRDLGDCWSFGVSFFVPCPFK